MFSLEGVGRCSGRCAPLSRISLEDVKVLLKIKSFEFLKRLTSSKEVRERGARLPEHLPTSSKEKRDN